jgi:hypothetical protein
VVKKKHTKKALIISTKSRKIHYISNLYNGKNHDFTILKQEFPNNKQWFEYKKVRLDLGFQGFDDLYKTQTTYLPHKKKRAKKGENNELTPQQIDTNKEQGKHRIFVEHAIGGAKRFKIIAHQSTTKLHRITNTIIGICAGLWNFLIH